MNTDTVQDKDKELRGWFFGLLDFLSALRGLTTFDVRDQDEVELTKSALSELIKHQDLQRCSIFLLRGDTLECAAGTDWDDLFGELDEELTPSPERRTIAFKIGEGLIGKAAQFRELQHCHDCVSDQRLLRNDSEPRLSGSLICVPILCRDDVLGVLNVYHSIPNYFRQWHEHSLTLFCSVLGQILDNNRLVRGMEKTVEERTGELRDANKRLRKQMMERQCSERTLRTIIDAVPAMINAKDADSRYIFMNSYQAELYGVNGEKAVGKTAADLLDPEYGSYTRELDQKVIETGESIPFFEEHYSDSKGEKHTFLTTKVPMPGLESEATRVATVSLDVTGRRQVEEEAKTTRLLLTNSIESMVDGFALFDSRDRLVLCNEQYKSMFPKISDLIVPGVHFDELGQAATERNQIVEVAGEHSDAIKNLTTRQSGSSVEYKTSEGRWIDARDHWSEGAGRVCIRIDITERRHSQEALGASNERFKDFAETAADWFWEMDTTLAFTYVSERHHTLSGLYSDEVIGRTIDEVYGTSLEEGAEQQYKQELHRKVAFEDIPITWNRPDNRARVYLISGRPVFDKHGTFNGYRGTGRDVTEAHSLSELLAYQARHDDLTGLINRREFETRLQSAMDTARDENTEHAMCYLDLDQFKLINDTCGHVAGDELLRQLAGLLQEQIRKGDVLARLGGDEFGVLLEECSLEQARLVAKSLHSTIEDFRFLWAERNFGIGVSIGLAPITNASESVAAVLSAADTACYAAKDQGRNRIHIYHEDDVESARRHGEMQWVVRLGQALEKGSLRLWYQSIVPIAEDEVGNDQNYYELLLRMEDQSGNVIMPGSFLPAAERYNLSSKLDRWVIDTIFERLSDQDIQHNLYAINLSGLSLGDDGFLTFVTGLFDKSCVQPDRICFEITETAAITNLASATRFIRTLKERGCRFALDDFGSGVSSFAYLKNLPVDYLKIDGGFVKDIVNDPVDLAMVKAINDMGHVLGKKTVAEFVENEQILHKLRELGVDYAQGYHIGRPQPIEDLISSPCRDRLLPATPVEPGLALPMLQVVE